MTRTLPIKLFVKIICMLLPAFAAFTSKAQDSIKHRQPLIYSFVVNHVPANFPFPLIGFVNVADGNQKNAQIGFTNHNQKNFSGGQVGFVNTIGGFCNGTQIGFIDLCKDSLKGAQIGFVNLTGSKIVGTQIGFVNLCKDSIRGAQIGYVNLAGRKVDGGQIGFVNVCKDTLNGGQVGFVNSAEKSIKGGQIGFVNLAGKRIIGSQVGFINVADSISGGASLGFLSIVHHGGYAAVEVGATSLFPANVSFKIGTPALYTTFLLSYSDVYSRNMAYGAGLGSILRINKIFSFNPEVTFHSTMERNSQVFTTLAPLFNINLFSRLALVAGPSVSWIHKGPFVKSALYKPSAGFYDYSFDKRNGLNVGAQIAVRLRVD